MIKKLLNFYQRRFWSCERYARYIGVEIGNNCSIATKKFGSEPYLISIGDNVQVTKDVVFLTHGGGWIFRDKYPLMDFFGKIKIKDNVYIGTCTLILPGVEIESNVIIGAGTVVTKSVKKYSIVAGNPGKVIGDIRDLEKKIQKYNLESKKMNSKEKRKFLLSQNEDKFIKI